MREQDFKDFAESLEGCLGIYGNRPPPATIAVWFKVMAAYQLSQFNAAISAHVADPKEGRFCPTPAHILSHLKVHDGRPTADEAWATAIQAQDEADSVVWTSETAQAFAVARPLLAIRDKVAARMAFKDAYERLTGEARAALKPVSWSLSEGHDADKRSLAVAQAVKLGRIPDGVSLGYTPLQLSDQSQGKLLSEMSADCQAKFKDLMARLRIPKEYVESDDSIAKRETEKKKRDLEARVEQHSKAAA